MSLSISWKKVKTLPSLNWVNSYTCHFRVQVGIATLAATTGVVAIALLFISSSLNAAFASFLVTVSTIGFTMAFFFSSITVVYVGALGFGGLTIGSIAFFSVWAVIILSGDSMHCGYRVLVRVVIFLVSCKYVKQER